MKDRFGEMTKDEALRVEALRAAVELAKAQPVVPDPPDVLTIARGFEHYLSYGTTGGWTRKT